MQDYEIRLNIKNNITHLRVESGMTQTELGELLDKKKTTVATWEQGGALPDAPTLYRIATYFNKTMDYMYGNNSKEWNEL